MIEIEKKFVDENEWNKTSLEECIEHTEKSGYWKPNTVEKMLTDGVIVNTPYAMYRKVL